MLGAVAELERGTIVERVRAGLVVAKAKGTRLGRLERTNESQQAAVAELPNQGAKVRGTGRRLDLPPNIVRWLQDQGITAPQSISTSPIPQLSSSTLAQKTRPPTVAREKNVPGAEIADDEDERLVAVG